MKFVIERSVLWVLCLVERHREKKLYCICNWFIEHWFHISLFYSIKHHHPPPPHFVGVTQVAHPVQKNLKFIRRSDGSGGSSSKLVSNLFTACHLHEVDSAPAVPSHPFLVMFKICFILFLILFLLKWIIMNLIHFKQNLLRDWFVPLYADNCRTAKRGEFFMPQ